MADQRAGGPPGAMARHAALARVAQATARSLDLEDMCQAACRALREAFGAEFAGVRVAQAGELRPIALDGDPAIVGVGANWLAEGGVVTTSEPSLWHGAEGWPGPKAVVDRLALPAADQARFRIPVETGLRGAALLPLRVEGRLEGALTIAWRRRLDEVEFDLETLELAAQYLAVALAHARQHAEAGAERARLATVLEAIPSVALVRDRRGRLIGCSAFAKVQLGLPADAPLEAVEAEIDRLTFWDATGRPIPHEELPMARALRGEAAPPRDMRIERPDGRRWWARVGGAPIVGEGGELLGAVTAGVSTTELVEAAEASQRAERRASAVARVARAVAASLEPTAVAGAACEALREAFGALSVVVRAAEPGGLRLLAYAADPSEASAVQEWLRQRAWLPDGEPHLLHDIRTWEGPREIEDLLELADAAVVFPPDAHERRMRGAIHLPLWAGDRLEGSMAITWPVPLSQTGVDTGTLALAGQYVAGALANARLHVEVERQRARSEAILASMGEGVVVTDREGRLVYRNAAAARISPRRPDARRPLPEQSAEYGLRDMAGAPVAPERSPLARALQGETVRERLRARRPDGGDVVIETTAAPIRAGDGSIDGAVLIFRDVTSTEEIDRLKDQFLATVAHDVRSPLSTIKGYAQGIARRAERSGDATLKRMGESIDAQVNAIDRLLSDLMDTRRIDQGRLEINRRRLDFVGFVRDTLEAIRLDTRFQGRELRVEMPSRPVLGQWDSALLRRVLENLLSNAAKYSPRETPIHVRGWVEEGWVRLAVTDHGIGIPEAEQPFVFDPFYRGSNARELSRGQGLGLYVARSMLEVQGGRLRLDSVEGQGTTFTLELPIA